MLGIHLLLGPVEKLHGGEHMMQRCLVDDNSLQTFKSVQKLVLDLKIVHIPCPGAYLSVVTGAPAFY